MRLTIMAAAILALSACDRTRDQPDAEPEASETTPPTQSIIRPDFQEPDIKPPLQTLRQTISFGEGGYELTDAARATLGGVLESAQIKEGGPIVLGGHTDASGNDTGNITASEKRNAAVRGWLVQRGVAEQRINSVPFGEQNPVEPNANPDGSPNEAGRAANRRVEITIGIGGDKPDTGESGAENISDAEPIATATPQR